MSSQRVVFYFLIPATSPPKMVTFDEMMAAARNLSNLTLAHEIAVNENFHLERIEHPQNR